MEGTRPNSPNNHWLEAMKKREEEKKNGDAITLTGKRTKQRRSSLEEIVFPSGDNPDQIVRSTWTNGAGSTRRRAGENEQIAETHGVLLVPLGLPSTKSQSILSNLNFRQR